MLLKARAVENQCYVLAANRVGLDQKNNHYIGDSQLISPLGEEMKLINDIESIKTFIIESTDLELIHEKLPFLKDI